MKRSRLLTITLIFLIMVSFNGCYPGVLQEYNTSGNNQQELPAVTIRFINSWGGSDPKAEALQKVFYAFTEKNTNVRIINDSLYGEDFLIKLKSDFASGNDPDVFGIWPGTDIQKLVEVGKVADLTDVLNNDPGWKEGFHDNVWSYTTFNNRVYGLPVEIIFEGLYVNTDLFEQYGVKIPVTYEELKSAVKTFRENGIIPIAFNCKAEGTYLYQNMAMMIGGKEAIENPIENQTVNACYIKALNKMKELYDLGAFPEDLFILSSVERNELFIQKKAAMIVQGSWFSPAIPDDSTVDFVPFPEMVKGKKRYTTMVYGLGGGTFYMSQKAWEDPIKREACLKLLRHLTSRETATYFAKETGMLSGVDIYTYVIFYDKLPLRGYKYTIKAKELVAPPDSFIPRTAWENVIVKEMPYVLEGKITPEKLWEKALN